MRYMVIAYRKLLPVIVSASLVLSSIPAFPSENSMLAPPSNLDLLEGLLRDDASAQGDKRTAGKQANGDISRYHRLLPRFVESIRNQPGSADIPADTFEEFLQNAERLFAEYLGEENVRKALIQVGMVERMIPFLLQYMPDERLAAFRKRLEYVVSALSWCRFQLELRSLDPETKVDQTIFDTAAWLEQEIQYLTKEAMESTNRLA